MAKEPKYKKWLKCPSKQIFCAIASAQKLNSNIKEGLAALWTCILLKHAKVKVGTLNPTSCNAEKPWPTPRKGQIILKGLLASSNYPKKQTIEFAYTTIL